VGGAIPPAKTKSFIQGWLLDVCPSGFDVRDKLIGWEFMGSIPIASVTGVKGVWRQFPAVNYMNKFTKSLYKLYQSLPADRLPQELVTAEEIEDNDAITPMFKSKHYTKKEFLDMIQRKDAK
jgi:hypothetical protein